MACNDGNEKSADNNTPEKKDTMKFSITEKPYGSVNNDSITQYTITKQPERPYYAILRQHAFQAHSHPADSERKLQAVRDQILCLASEEV